MRFAGMDGKKKKQIVRIYDQFYYQNFTQPYVYSYQKVRLNVHVTLLAFGLQ